jgi:hypothetical protein
MEVLVILLGLVKCATSKDNMVLAERRLFLENYFWNADADKNGLLENLFKFDFFIESKDRKSGMFHDLSTNFYLEFTKMRYAMIPNWMEKDFDFFLKGFKEYKFFIRFHYSGIYAPITGYLCLDEFKKAQNNCNTSLLPYKKPLYVVNLKFDEMETCMFNLRMIVEGMIRMKILSLKLILKQGFKKYSLVELAENMDFDLNYFEEKLRCCLSLRKFIKQLRYLKLVSDNRANNKNEQSSSESKTNLKISEFIDLLTDKFNEREKLDTEEYRVSLRMFTWCCKFIKNELLRKNVLFLIEGQYSIDYYLNEIFQIVNKFVTENLRRFALLNFEEEKYANTYMNERLNSSLRSLEFKAVKDLVVSENFYKYFSDFLGRKIKTLDDFKIVEKILCDYHNTLVRIANLNEKNFNSTCSLFNYCTPSTVSFDGYKYRIVDGLVIKPLSDNSILKEIKAFDNKGIEVILKKGTDYFKDEWGCYHIISKVLMDKNIYEIEAITSNNLNEVFMVNEYLNIE